MTLKEFGGFGCMDPRRFPVFSNPSHRKRFQKHHQRQGRCDGSQDSSGWNSWVVLGEAVEVPHHAKFAGANVWEHDPATIPEWGGKPQHTQNSHGTRTLCIFTVPRGLVTRVKELTLSDTTGGRSIMNSNSHMTVNSRWFATCQYGWLMKNWISHAWINPSEGCDQHSSKTNERIKLTDVLRYFDRFFFTQFFECFLEHVFAEIWKGISIVSLSPIFFLSGTSLRRCGALS